MWKFIGLTCLFLEESWVENPTFVTSNMCAYSPGQWGSARVAQWWEHSPPTNAARVQTPVLECGLCLLLVLCLAARGFSPSTPVFPSPQKPTFPNSNSTRIQVDEEPLRGCATTKSLSLLLLLRSLHAGHHQYPISNESNPGNIFGLCGLTPGCVKRTVKRFSFVFFIHHCKTVIIADQTSSFYPSIDVILYWKYLK